MFSECRFRRKTTNNHPCQTKQPKPLWQTCKSLLGDGNGKPTAIYPCHHKHAQANFVGAAKTLDVTQKAKFVDIKASAACVPKLRQFDRSKAVFSFSFEPVDVPADGEIGAYYKRGIKTGAIIPANKGNGSRAASRSSR